MTVFEKGNVISALWSFSTIFLFCCTERMDYMTEQTLEDKGKDLMSFLGSQMQMCITIHLKIFLKAQFTEAHSRTTESEILG
jgi:hypothetical protein